MCSRRKPRRSGKAGAGIRGFLLLAAFCFAACAVARGEQKVDELQEKFDREAKGSGKVKLLEKLGEAQFAAATQAQKAETYPDVGLIFEKYRDNVVTCFTLLKKQDPDVDKHANDYRHLELQVRRGLRELDEIMMVVPEYVRPPLQLVKQDLLDADNGLIALLFPARMTPKKPAGKP